MATQQIKTIRKYIDLFLRRKFIIISLALLGVTTGLAVYLLQPKVYQSTALLSYQQQKINPAAKMSPDVQQQIRDIVSTISQIITSRTNLEKIINDVGLYQEARRSLPMEDVIEKMRENIFIEPSDRGDTFRITFMGSQPNQVVRVTNALAAGFIDENLKYREERASETSAYVADELNMAKTVLDRKESVMRDYKLKYYNEMPEQRATNVARLISLQEQHQSKQESIQDLERTRILVQDQIGLRRQQLESGEQVPAVSTQERAVTPQQNIRAKLARLQWDLSQLQQVYTDQHPQIIHLKTTISNLEQTISALPPEPAEDDQSGLNVEQSDKIMAELQLQLKAISLNIEELAKEKEAIKNQIEQYEQWVAAAPVREAEWSALTREYGELKRHYDFLVSQNLQARSALNLERTQKGSQFKIEDPGRIPEKPVKPDFLKIMGLALFFGTCLGGALAFGLEFVDTSFNNPDELQSFARMEVVCAIPQVALPEETRRDTLKNVLATLFYIAYTAVLIGAFVYLWSEGKIIV